MTNWKEKFYIGSQWKTREGEHAVVVDHDYDDGLVPLRVWHSKKEKTFWHNTFGECVTTPRENGYCLIEPWKEPRTGYIEVYEFDDGSIIPQMPAETNIHNGRKIAVIPWVEGEGIVEDSECKD